VSAREHAATRVAAWFAARGWAPFAFQHAVWAHVAAGRSGLLHATTGAGKTLAVWFGALQAFEPPRAGTRVLWITPMRALAQDTGRALGEPLTEVAPGWSVGVRTGDTPAGHRARQERTAPTALVTTPESLSLMLSRADAAERMAAVGMVIVDEWHELLGNKRGVQVQLALARLRRWNPRVVVWGLSATLGDLDEAQCALGGGVLVRGELPKTLVVDTLIPPTIERFPWAGHLGTRLVAAVAAEIERAATTLVFTNTRSQAELWYQALLEARPDWAGTLALHHGALDRAARDWVETGLKAGTIKACVCTSSLDLGVDFLPVERVLQIGSPKGVARLLQRAGRSGHAPGRASRVTCVPTHALELVEAAAARCAAGEGRIESRAAPSKPLDVLVQHLVTVALGGGFRPDELYAEVRTAHSYRGLSRAEFDWALAFVTRGGSSLRAYPEYHRVTVDDTGRHLVRDRRIASRHRMSIGTIVADSAMEVRYLSGGRIGHVEESFIARMRRGDCFLFGGRCLELVRVHEMTAYVRKADGRERVVPRWNGGKMPLSSELAAATMGLVQRARDGQLDEPELAALAPLFDIQRRWSRIPAADEVLIERVRTREGYHLFCYPFGGRNVHTGLASLAAWRSARRAPATFSICVNDYGFELLSPSEVDWDRALAEGLFSRARLAEDVIASLNESELARRRFREIARVAGLVFQGYPGEARRARALQASSALFYDVFARHEPDNLLLAQARREVLEQELELGRLDATLERIAARRLVVVDPPRPTPFAFPLMVERIREKFSNEKVADRVARMVGELERAAGQ
jgi:ATP-dependent Lhr-like helicase